MNVEITKIEKRLAEAQAAQAAMRSALNKTAGEFDNLDVTTGDIDEAVEKKLKLQTKRDILAKRLELADGAVKQLQGDLLIERENDLKNQVKMSKTRLEKVKEDTRLALLKLTTGVLALHEQAVINSFVEIHKDVKPIIAEVETLTRRYGEAEGRARETNRKRLMAESQEINAAQNDVFEGRI